MSGTPDACSDSPGFTCGALLMCLYLLGLSKKKPEVEVSAAASGPSETAPNEPAAAEQAPPLDAPSRAASLEKSECASPYSGSNIVFDFVVGGGVDRREEQGSERAVHGYCPSPCFDLPVEMIRAGQRFGAGGGGDSDAPVTAAFVFNGDGGHRGGAALQKMASCLAPGAPGGGEPPHLVRFLSASGRSSVARPPVVVMPSRGAPQGMEGC
jgi:hypothetical protein